MALLEQKYTNWDLIKQYYPDYEVKQPVLKEFISHYLKKENIVLDIGCGRGKESVINYQNKVDCSLGIDISEAIKLNTTIHFPVQGDATKIPLSNESIDIVISQELLEHLPEPEEFFQEVSRVLKPTGYFILVTPNLLSWKSLISFITPYSFHKKMNQQLYDIPASDVFPTYYKMNRINKIKKNLKMHHLTLDKLVMWESSPRTLTFNRLTTYIDIGITTALKKYSCLQNYRELIVSSFKKNEC